MQESEEFRKKYLNECWAASRFILATTVANHRNERRILNTHNTFRKNNIFYIYKFEIN